MSKTLRCLPSRTWRGERRVTCASLTRSSSSQLKSVSAGRQSYFWHVSDTNTTIKPTPWQILANAAEHLNRIIPAAYIFLFCRGAAAQTCCLWFNSNTWQEVWQLAEFSVTSMGMKLTQSISCHPHSFPVWAQLCITLYIYYIQARFNVLTANTLG